jgi:hypothetical protein
MFSLRGRRPHARFALLHLTHECAEWLANDADGAVRYAKAPVLGPTAADLASAASTAFEQAMGGALRKRVRCVLALGGKLVEPRVLALPELARGALQRILPRKAAGLLGVELSDALYAALPLAKEPRNGAEPHAEQKWFLLAMRRSLVAPLSIALQRSHFDVERVTCASLARLCAAQELRGDESAACIVIDVDLDAVVVSLIHNDELRMQNRILGSFDGAPTMALTLIQEIRTFDAFWRKQSRGEGVAQVVVFGIGVERGKLFGNAVSSALAGARVIVRPEASDPSAEPESADCAHRVASLAACRAAGPFSLDAPLPTPPRMAPLVAVAACALLAAGSAGAVLRERLNRELRDVRAQGMAHEKRTADLESVRDDNRRVEAQLAEATAETERFVASLSVGIPLGAALDSFARASGRDANLRSLSLERVLGDGEVRFSGFAPVEPLAAVRALKGVERELEASGVLQSVWIAPPTIRGRDEREQGLAFDGRAEWEAQP